MSRGKTGSHFRTMGGKPSKLKKSGRNQCEIIAERVDGSLLNGRRWDTDILSTRQTENSSRYVLNCLFSYFYSY